MFCLKKYCFTHHSSWKTQVWRSIAQIDYYEHTIFKIKDGWDQYLIHVIEGDYGDHAMYHKDPLEALFSMFSSPSLKENFQIAPSNGIHQGVYSTPI
jgi:hypothetical protein